MPANLIIDHKQATDADVKSWLEGAFGSAESSALGKSVLGKRVKDNPKYCGWEVSQYIMIAHIATNFTLEVTIEPVGDMDMREVCETVWLGIYKNGKKHRPKLRGLWLNDGVSGHKLAEAKTGFWQQMAEPENKVAMATALITLILVGATMIGFDVNQDALLAAAPPVAVALALTFVAAVQWRHLVWR